MGMLHSLWVSWMPRREEYIKTDDTASTRGTVCMGKTRKARADGQGIKFMWWLC